jgi:molybdopterin-guanine dinucleotide biosynthesis adapter protein
VKHRHSDFPATVDSEVTDTWRHRHAGAASVALATPTDLAMFGDNVGASSLDEIVSELDDTDIVLVEGLHEEACAKIEVLADCNDDPPCK